MHKISNLAISPNTKKGVAVNPGAIADLWELGFLSPLLVVALGEYTHGPPTGMGLWPITVVTTLPLLTKGPITSFQYVRYPKIIKPNFDFKYVTIFSGKDGKMKRAQKVKE